MRHSIVIAVVASCALLVFLGSHDGALTSVLESADIVDETTALVEEGESTVLSEMSADKTVGIGALRLAATHTAIAVSKSSPDLAITNMMPPTPTEPSSVLLESTSTARAHSGAEPELREEIDMSPEVLLEKEDEASPVEMWQRVQTWLGPNVGHVHLVKHLNTKPDVEGKIEPFGKMPKVINHGCMCRPPHACFCRHPDFKNDLKRTYHVELNKRIKMREYTEQQAKMKLTMDRLNLATAQQKAALLGKLKEAKNLGIDPDRVHALIKLIHNTIQNPTPENVEATTEMKAGLKLEAENSKKVMGMPIPVNQSNYSSVKNSTELHDDSTAKVKADLAMEHAEEVAEEEQEDEKQEDDESTDTSARDPEDAHLKDWFHDHSTPEWFGNASDDAAAETTSAASQATASSSTTARAPVKVSETAAASQMMSYGNPKDALAASGYAMSEAKNLQAEMADTDKLLASTSDVLSKLQQEENEDGTINVDLIADDEHEHAFAPVKAAEKDASVFEQIPAEAAMPPAPQQTAAAPQKGAVVMPPWAQRSSEEEKAPWEDDSKLLSTLHSGAEGDSEQSDTARLQQEEQLLKGISVDRLQQAAQQQADKAASPSAMPPIEQPPTALVEPDAEGTEETSHFRLESGMPPNNLPTDVTTPDVRSESVSPSQLCGQAASEQECAAAPYSNFCVFYEERCQDKVALGPTPPPTTGAPTVDPMPPTANMPAPLERAAMPPTQAQLEEKAEKEAAQKSEAVKEAEQKKLEKERAHLHALHQWIYKKMERFHKLATVAEASMHGDVWTEYQKKSSSEVQSKLSEEKKAKAKLQEATTPEKKLALKEDEMVNKGVEEDAWKAEAKAMWDKSEKLNKKEDEARSSEVDTKERKAKSIHDEAKMKTKVAELKAKGAVEGKKKFAAKELRKKEREKTRDSAYEKRMKTLGDVKELEAKGKEKYHKKKESKVKGKAAGHSAVEAAEEKAHKMHEAMVKQSEAAVKAGASKEKMSKTSGKAHEKSYKLKKEALHKAKKLSRKNEKSHKKYETKAKEKTAKATVHTHAPTRAPTPPPTYRPTPPPTLPPPTPPPTATEAMTKESYNKSVQQAEASLSGILHRKQNGDSLSDQETNPEQCEPSTKKSARVQSLCDAIKKQSATEAAEASEDEGGYSAAAPVVVSAAVVPQQFLSAKMGAAATVKKGAVVTKPVAPKVHKVDARSLEAATELAQSLPDLLAARVQAAAALAEARDNEKAAHSELDAAHKKGSAVKVKAATQVHQELQATKQTAQGKLAQLEQVIKAAQAAVETVKRAGGPATTPPGPQVASRTEWKKH